MTFCDEVRKVTVGDRTWAYQAFYDDRWVCKCVRFYDGEDDGCFITEFDSGDDMREYLARKDSERVNKELDALKSFRKKADMMVALNSGENREKGIGEEEKAENQKVFMKRLRMLQADMTDEAFGRIVGLGAGVVFNLRVGKRYVGAHTAKRIAERCGVTIDWLLGGNE